MSEEIREQEAVYLYNLGWSRNVIGDTLHMDKGYIQNLVKEYGDANLHKENRNARLARNLQKSKERGISRKEVTLASKFGLFEYYGNELDDEKIRVIKKVSPTY